MQNSDQQIFLTVDGLVTDGTSVILIKRAHEPFLETLVLPGGHVDFVDESAKAACARELSEEINFQPELDQLELLMILDKPDRDPRPNRRISIVYLIALPELPKNIQAQSDAKQIVIRELKNLKPEEIGFDHIKAIELAKERLAKF